MPRIRKSFEDENRTFSNIIKAQIIRQGIGTQENLGRKIGECKSTTTKKINQPDSLTIEELRMYVKHLDIKPQEVLELIYGKEKSARTSRDA